MNKDSVITSLRCSHTGDYGKYFLKSHQKGHIETTSDLSQAKLYTRRGAKMTITKIKYYGHDHMLYRERLSELKKEFEKKRLRLLNRT